MTQTQTIVDVAIIVRQFLQTEARTLAISKGKMLKDDELEREAARYLKVS